VRAARPPGVRRPYLIGRPIMRVSTFLPTLRPPPGSAGRVLGDSLKPGRPPGAGRPPCRGGRAGARL